MENQRDEQQPGREEKPPVVRKPGGGPYAPGGDAEPSNIPGEARERGLRPAPPVPVVRDNEEEESAAS